MTVGHNGILQDDDVYRYYRMPPHLDPYAEPGTAAAYRLRRWAERVDARLRREPADRLQREYAARRKREAAPRSRPSSD